MSVSVTLEPERETKNTVRFREAVEDGEQAIIGILYVPKPTLKEMGTDGSKSIVVTLDVELKQKKGKK
jgi:hypothetical protein